MPEGDTLHRLARRLTPPLVGATIDAAHSRSQGPLEPIVGARVEQISALGKHLLILLDGGWALRVHLGIAGRCDVYAPGQRWRRSKGSATLVVRTAEHEVVFFRAPQARLLRRAHLRATPGLVSLGPDLLAPTLDLDEVMRRLRQTGNARRPLGEVLLDQRVAAGIGNVYKCELLFLRRLDPWRPVQRVDDDALRELFALARKLMRKNLSTRRRITRFEPGGRHWVYGRTGEGCFRCDARIASRRQGDQARTTYYCPACQRSTGGRRLRRPGAAGSTR